MLCLKAVCWLAPRFLEPSPKPAGNEITVGSTVDGTAGRTSFSNNDGGGGGSGQSYAAGTTKADSAARVAAAFQEKYQAGAAAEGGRLGEGEGTERGEGSPQDGPLQLLLELGAGHLGAGVEGLHTSLSLMGGALRGLESMAVRRAFASSLRAHLGNVQVDSVFRFDAPKSSPSSGGAGGSSGGGGGGGGGGGDGFPSPGRLALPPLLNWATFRKYTTTMWVRLDPAADGGAVTLFRFRNGEGIGVEATLSAAGAAGMGTTGGGGSGSGGSGGKVQGGRRKISVTSFARPSQKSSSAHCKFGPQAEAVYLGGSGGRGGEGVRQGGWRFVVVSHGQPYVKRAGRLRVSVDGVVVLDAELPYPAATGLSAKDPVSRSEEAFSCCVFVVFPFFFSLSCLVVVMWLLYVAIFRLPYDIPGNA